MARIRTIKPSFFRSRSLAKCSRDARLTFAGMWCDGDSAGRGIADGRILKGALWPLDDDITHEVVEAHLAELAVDHIVLYEVDGERYYEIRNWENHQAASYRSGDPQFPGPDEGKICTDVHATCTPLRAVREGKVREGNSSLPPNSSAQEEPDPKPPRKRTARDDLWDAVVASFEEPPRGPTGESRVGKIVKDLVALEATPDDYKRRWSLYAKKWPTWTRTPEAVVKHWPDLAGGDARPQSMFNGARLDEHAARRM